MQLCNGAALASGANCVFGCTLILRCWVCVANSLVQCGQNRVGCELPEAPGTPHG